MGYPLFYEKEPIKPVVDLDKEQDSKEDEKTQKPSLYGVVLHNDSINGIEFVIGVLIRVFSYSMQKAVWLTLKAHTTGKAVVWKGSREIAETKASQITEIGPDPSTRKRKGAKPLSVTVEKVSA